MSTEIKKILLSSHNTMMKILKKLTSLITCILLLVGSGTIMAQNVNENTIDWYELSEAQKLAQSNDKKVFIFAEADWCSYCKQMKREFFPREDVQKIMSNNYYPVKINIESDRRLIYNEKEMTQRQFSQSMEIAATPTMFFLDKNGEVMGTQPGYVPLDTFKALLKYVNSDSYGKIEFEKYLEEF
jgi:thioredoxin-related protein